MKLPRIRFRFSLRTLLIAVPLLGLICGLLARMQSRARMQASAVNQLQEREFLCEYTPWCPALFGTRDGMRSIPDIPNLVSLQLIDGADLLQGADAERFVASLNSLSSLRILDIEDPSTDDRIIDQVRKLQRLKKLEIGHASLSKSGLTGLRREMPHCDVKVGDGQAIENDIN